MPEFIQERKSKDGKYTTYRVNIPYYDGNERKFFSESFSSKKYGSKKIALELAKECRDKMRKYLNIDGVVIAKEKYTPLEILNKSFDTFPISCETKRKHIILFNRYIAPYIKDIDDFTAIRKTHIQKSLNEMIECSNDTIQRVFSIWKRLYRTAIFFDILTVDNTIKVTIPKSEKISVKRSVTTTKEKLDEVCRLLFEKADTNDALLVSCALTIMYYTGMRPSEVYALERQYIDRDNKTIHICQAIGSNTKQEHTVVRTKTHTSIRTIPYPEPLEEVFDLLDGKDFLFKRKNGEFLNGNFVSNLLHRITHGEFRTYMLRHQFSTDLIKKNIDIRTIQDLMGHTSQSMTLEYARADEETMKEAIKKR